MDLTSPELVSKRLFCILGFLNKRTYFFSALIMNHAITMQNLSETYSTGYGTKLFEKLSNGSMSSMAERTIIRFLSKENVRTFSFYK